MLALINRILDWFKSLFWKEEMELTLVGLQYSGKTTFVNVIAVRISLKSNIHHFTNIVSHLFDTDNSKSCFSNRPWIVIKYMLHIDISICTFTWLGYFTYVPMAPPPIIIQNLLIYLNIVLYTFRHVITFSKCNGIHESGILTNFAWAIYLTLQFFIWRFCILSIFLRISNCVPTRIHISNILWF